MEPTIYLFFKGDCHTAMTRYAEVLGGEVLGVFRNGEVPSPECRMPGGDDLVLHMSVRVGSTTLMGSDSPEQYFTKPQGFRVALSPKSREEFDRVHAALSRGAAATGDDEMGPGETFWAERFAMFTDEYGTPWMLNFEGSKANR